MLHYLGKYKKEVSHLTYLRNNFSFAHYYRTFKVDHASITNKKQHFLRLIMCFLTFSKFVLYIYILVGLQWWSRINSKCYFYISSVWFGDPYQYPITNEWSCMLQRSNYIERKKGS